VIDLDLYARVVDFFDQLELAGKSGPSICTRQNHHMAQKHRRSEGRRVTADSIGAPGLSQNAGTTTGRAEDPLSPLAHHERTAAASTSTLYTPMRAFLPRIEGSIEGRPQTTTRSSPFSPARNRRHAAERN
jgi:hypothetical protein